MTIVERDDIPNTYMTLIVLACDTGTLIKSCGTNLAFFFWQQPPTG